MQSKQIQIPLFTDISGNEIKINGLEIGRGNPKIYIQGGTHGGEVTFYILKELYKLLQSTYKQGTVVLIPISNPISWNQRMYNYTVGKFDMQSGKDWSRNFPGSRNKSLLELRANKLFNFAKDYDVVIDLHTSRKSIPFGIFNGDNINKQLIKCVGLKYNYLISSTGDTSMMSALSDIGISAFEIECGSHDSYEVKYIQKVFDAIKNVLSSYQIIDCSRQANTTNKETVIFNAWSTCYSPCSGFVEYECSLGDTIKEGQDICKIWKSENLFSYAEVKAKTDIIIMKKLQSNILWKGDQIIQGIDRSIL
jgi:predicted deacylase